MNGGVDMLVEFLVPLCTLVVSMGVCVCCIHQLCLFHQIYLTTQARLESERWLVSQCEDPNFFTKMHLHTDLCFTVSDNARVGVAMLSLQEFTRRILVTDVWGGRWGAALWVGRVLFSWTGAGLLVLLLVVGPSWLFQGTRALGRRWPECRDAHFKDA